jgi:hypothetical protein
VRDLSLRRRIVPCPRRIRDEPAASRRLKGECRQTYL